MISMIFALFCFFGFLPPQAVQSDGIISEIKAKDVDYDGKRICLTGDVRIEHRFGKLVCDKAIIFLLQSKDDDEKSFTPEYITLEGNVKAELKDGSTLTSQLAEINCNTLEGVFTAANPEKVIYIANMQEGSKTVPVKTSSSAMRIRMKKKENSSEYVFSDLQGEGSVSIEYQNNGMIQ
jgi:lipopolysaccharide assembly outer membrane protein LptD (OstA)